MKKFLIASTALGLSLGQALAQSQSGGGGASGLAPIATSGSATDLSVGTAACARLPALTGDATTTAGSCATTVANSALTNTGTLQTTTYTVQASDKGKIIPLGGNTMFTVTVNAPTSYPSDMSFALENVDRYTGPNTGRGKRIHIVSGGAVSDFILWPGDGQIAKFSRTGSTWFIDRPARWKLPSQGVLNGALLTNTALAWNSSSENGYVLNGIFITSGTVTGSIQLGQAIGGTGASTPPVILKQLDGTANGPGQYLTDSVTLNAGTFASPIALTTAGVVATVADTAWLQTEDPANVAGATPSGYNATGTELVVIDTTHYGYALASSANPGSATVFGTVRDTQQYLELRADPALGQDDFLTDGLGTGSGACNSLNFCLTAYWGAQFDSFFQGDAGGATYVRVTGAANQTDTVAIHHSTLGELSAGGHAIIVSGNPGFVHAGNSTINTDEANLRGTLRYEHITLDAGTGRACIAPHQGGEIFINNLVTLRNCPTGDIVGDEQTQFLASGTILIDCSLGSPTNLFNIKNNSVLENGGASNVIFLNSCAYSSDVAAAIGDSFLNLGGFYFDLGGTRYTPTALTWSAGVVTVTVPDTSALTVGDTIQVMGAQAGDPYHLGYNGIYTIASIPGGGTTFTYAQATNPGQAATVMGVVVDNPRATVSGRTFEAHSGSWVNTSSGNVALPGTGQIHDSGSGISNDSVTSDINSWPNPQTFTGTTNASGGGSPVTLGSNTYSTLLSLPLNAASGVPRMLKYQTAGVDFWKEGLVGGTDFEIDRLNSSGVLQGVPFKISSAAGLTTVADGGLALSGSTAHGIPITEGASALGNTGAGTTGQYLGGVTGADPAFATVQFSQLGGSATGAQLPNPSASTLGGIESYAAVSHQFINSISTSGVPASAQPVLTDISGYSRGTFASRPAAAVDTFYYATDLGPSGCLLFSDGTVWKPASGSCLIYNYAAAPVSGAAAVNTTSSTEANLQSYTAPAGLGIANSSFEVHVIGLATGTANTKTLSARAIAGSSPTTTGGMQFMSETSVAANLSGEFTRTLVATGASSQVSAAAGSTGASWTGNTAPTASINMANAWTFSFNASAANNSADTVGYAQISIVWRD